MLVINGLQAASTLPFATPEEVAREARENARIFSAGGGYVFANVHNIQAEVPPENIVALFDGVRTLETG